MNTEKSQFPTIFAAAFFWLISTAHSAAIEIKPGNYILVKIPSTAEALNPTDVGVVAAKVFEKDGKLQIYFKNKEGPNDTAVDEDGKGQSLTDGIFEIITGSSRGDILFFRSIDGKKEDPELRYLGSVYRGGVWGETYRGVFIDRHGKPDGQGIFLLIPGGLTVELPDEGSKGEAEQDGAR